MSLLADRDFSLYYIRHAYLDRVQEALVERVIHISHDLHTLAWALSDDPHLAPLEAVPAFNPVHQSSPPIPKFITSHRIHRGRSSARSQSTPPSELDSANQDELSRQKRRPKPARRNARLDATISSDSDFGSDGSSYDDDDYDDEDDEEDEGDTTTTTTGKDASHPVATPQASQASIDADELGIEEFQRAARQIKFSKMPARAKDAIVPDADQMLSTFIQTKHRSRQSTGNVAALVGAAGYRSTANDTNLAATRRNASESAGWQTAPTEDEVAEIGLAGNTESKKGISFLQASSLRRDALLSEISMDDAIMEEPPFDEQDNAPDDAVNDSAAKSAPNEHHLTPISAMMPPVLLAETSTPSRDLSRFPKPYTHVSKLTELIKLSHAAEKNPFEKFASISGIGELKHLELKIYRPKSSKPTVPFSVIVKPEASVADTIGYSLYRYWEERREPRLTDTELDVNKWTLRIVEDDGEPDVDFPALDRRRIISAFSFDEFALVEATPQQARENARTT
ncbi:stress-activated map kinase interacting protein 1-domain-containing protein [Limtongia smithiae]|uniref:stress-activated map kinase interacting protein 1-domain-containing protein n=1 Tax=Limtongia smithiae TaxID=1125753 RepID=UPI0034CDEEDE